jgi:hypothetical protein
LFKQSGVLAIMLWAMVQPVMAETNAELGLESRFFFEDALFGQDRHQSSLKLEVETRESTDTDVYSGIVFFRLDREDNERRYYDIREALWTRVNDDWEFRAGVGKVFWGVTESRHLVDIINQSDLVENIDGEDKLGQPMTRLSFERDWGALELFWLPYFRERSFPGEEGRLRPPILVETGSAEFDSAAREWRGSGAVRYAHAWGELEYAVSHFSGVSRDPELEFSGTALTPVYQIIEQTGVELQYIYEDWIYKLEGISSSGYTGGRFSAAVVGFERTQVGIFDSQADLGWLLEYLFDDRKADAPHSFERDIFAGWRYAFNDEDSSEILAGLIYDPQSAEKMYSIEMSRRITGDFKIFLEARLFAGAEAPEPDLMSVLASLTDHKRKTAMLQKDDYIQLEFVKYF